MIKTKAKYIIITLLFLFALILFNTNTVNATTEEEAQKALDLVPDEIYLDIPEIEYEKSGKLVEEEILKIWSDNGINKDDMTFNIWGYQPFSVDYFYKGGINIDVERADTSGDFINKTIKITYNNTNNKNTSIENYIKNLKLEKCKYFDVDISKVTQANIFDVTKEYYSKIVNDSSVEVITTATAGGNSPLSYGVETLYIMLFKEGNLYDVREMGQANTIGVIEVPNSVSNTEFEKYSINLINKYLDSSPKKDLYTERVTSITKSTGKENITDGYTVNYDNGKYEYVKIKRIPNTPLQIKDETTNIKIDTDTTVLPANTKLVVKELTEGETYKVAEKLLTNDVEKMYVYDITLQSEDVTVQPDGKVKVSIPIPEGLDTNKLVVYSINDNGTKTEYTVKVETVDNIKYATFETEHFSTYVLGEKAEETTTTNTETTAKGEKDVTPKTGATATIAGITALVILIGTVVIIKKCK